MDVRERMCLVRIIEKIEKNPEFSGKIGVTNRSHDRRREQNIRNVKL